MTANDQLFIAPSRASNRPQSQVGRILDPLNPAQLDAVTHGDGPMLVLAGAGSGKTRVLTHRIAYLIDVKGVDPHNIMAVTFTNKAAGEMKERVIALAGRPGEWVTIGTFHAFCVRLLRRESDYFHRPNFTIYDTADQLALVKQAMDIAEVPESRARPQAVLGAISDAKNELIGPSQYQPNSYFEELVRRVYPVYQDLLRQNSAFDFDDLIMETVTYLREHSDRLDHYATRYQYILVDEYQDTNHTQYVLVNMLASKHRNLFVVGDDDQSVYSWRGADIRNILEFERDYPDVREIKLEQNYRSTQNILDAANGVIAQNYGRKPKRLWTEKDTGPSIRLFHAYDEEQEARFVADEIDRLVQAGEVAASDCAVMYRMNAQSRALEEAFIRANIPYILVGATRFYERREIKDVVAFLRLIVNPNDGVTLRRVINVPPRKIGATTVQALRRWAEVNGVPLMAAVERAADVPGLTPAARNALAQFAAMIAELRGEAQQLNVLDLLDLVLRRAGYESFVRDGSDEGEERWSNILELRTVAQDYAAEPPLEGLRSFLENVSLLGETDVLTEARPHVPLMTLHAAKGLEFSTVFLVGMEENLFPHSRSLESIEQMEEERRLCYVGITRAKERLYLIHAARRMFHGNTLVNPPSRFLADIPERLWDESGVNPRSYLRREFTPVSSGINLLDEPVPAARGPVTQRFGVGERVRHKHFGTGVILSSTLTADDEEVEVEFASPKGPVRKKLLVSYAALEAL
ncbi:MAG TPA: UvrD-helicase domain-containing protein [Chloroflexota bacterium]|nr:UvrD-helicase domain-containing protein [Chloroflexota bacterium]